MKLFVSAICGLFSCLIEFVAIPLVFSTSPLLGAPDFIWMALRILLPVAAAVLLLRRIWHIPSGFVWAGLPVQYLLLFFWAKQISGIIGITLDGLGGFEYLFEAAVWPFAVTLLQFSVLFCLEKFENK